MGTKLFMGCKSQAISLCFEGCEKGQVIFVAKIFKRVTAVLEDKTILSPKEELLI